MARYARQCGVPLPALVGAPLSRAEFDAMGVVSGEWSFTEGLLVAVAERVDMVRFILQKVHSKERSRVTEPLHIPRPGEKAEVKSGPPVVKPGELARMLRGGW